METKPTSGVTTMSEAPDSLSKGVRWGSRLAAVGLMIAALSVVVASAGLEVVGPLYWIGILLSVGGVVGAAVREAQNSDGWYEGGAILALVGVLVIAYGIENGGILPTVVGALAIAAGAGGVIVGTQRVTSSRT